MTTDIYNQNYSIKILGEGTRSDIAAALINMAAELMKEEFNEEYFQDGEYYNECVTITDFQPEKDTE